MKESVDSLRATDRLSKDSLKASKSELSRVKDESEAKIKQLDERIKQLEERSGKLKSDYEGASADLENVSNYAVMLVYDFCKTCKDWEISVANCDSIEKMISHLGTLASNPGFVNEVLKIFAGATTLVTSDLCTFFQTNLEHVGQLKKDLEAMTKLCDSKQKQLDLIPDHVLLDEMEGGTMKTTISCDTQMIPVGESAMGNLLRQNKYLQSTVSVYQNEIEELASRLQAANQLPVALGADQNSVSQQLEYERSQCVLWRIRAEQLELTLSMSVDNQSCLTDSDLANIEVQVNSLMTDVFNTTYDMGLPISLESMKSVYHNSVKQNESREPPEIETNLYCTKTMIDSIIKSLLDDKYVMEMAASEMKDEIRKLRYQMANV